MNTDYIFLNPAPMPYLTDCDYKKFEPNEYHISRIVDFFVLIFMLRGSLHFIEDDVSVSVQEGEWYIQRKNLRQGADRPSPGAEYYYFHFNADYTLDLLNRIKLPLRGTFSASLLLPSFKKLCSLFHQRQIVKDFLIKFTKNPKKRCQKHRMAPDTSFDRLHFSVQQVFAEIRIVWQLVDIWLPAPLNFGQFQRIGCFQCMIVACHI